ncbi:MAG: hypothetical protein NTX42_02710 [Methanothrix sp.]|nr:hypothetical protein [Methanothrix sp.]
MISAKRLLAAAGCPPEPGLAPGGAVRAGPVRPVDPVAHTSGEGSFRVLG